MGFFDFLKQPDVNQSVADYHNTPGAVLLDVRTPQEYSEGHIPESKNVPLQTLDKVRAVAENKDTELLYIAIPVPEADRLRRHSDRWAIPMFGTLAA